MTPDQRGSRDEPAQPLRVGIDTRSLRQGPAGIATYVRNLVERLDCLDPLAALRPSNNLLWNQIRVPPAQLRRGWTLYHAPSYTAPLFNFCPLVLTAPDISYLARPQWYPYRVDPLRRWYYAASLRRADRIIVTSDFSRREVERVLPDLAPRVRRTYLAVSPFFGRDESLAEAVRVEMGLPTRFLLHVGDIHPRRCVRLLAEVAEAVEMPLVVVGRILQGADWLKGYPHHYTDITLEQLKGIYSAADVLVYASLYEGFGLPVLEALACGTPVVAAERSCIPEVCGEAAILVEPEFDALVGGVREALRAAPGLQALGPQRAKLFTWDRTARETEAIYRELV